MGTSKGNVMKTFNGPNPKLRDLYLTCIAVIYFFAFGSFYYQVPGWYGDNGILPLKLSLKPGKSLQQDFLAKPTLVWLAPFLQLDLPSMLELVALTGVVLSVICSIFSKLRDTFCFAVLWILYLSLYEVGQRVSFAQWESLLLEAGFLTILIAPLNLLKWRPIRSNYHDAIVLWLVKWLCFRLTFSSGVAKLTSMCPKWWQLTALNYHFESQYLPTPVAWYAHHLSEWFLKVGIVWSLVIQIILPFLFFSPVRSLRIFSFYAQILLQLTAILTGNFSYSNLLAMVICLSLLDDRYLKQGQVSSDKWQLSDGSLLKRSLTRILELVTYSALVYWTVTLFSLKLTQNFTIESRITFKGPEFHLFLEKAVQVSVYVGAASLAIVILKVIYQSLHSAKGIFAKLLAFVRCVFFASIAGWIFCISMVPYTVIDPALNSQIWPVIQRWHSNVEKFHLVDSYGLSRKMTGVGGRPEIVLEGSNSMTEGWKEYYFLYKPGNLSQVPSFVTPYNPNLDYHMWNAALGTYQQNPWFMSLVSKLLNGQKEVLDLLDKDHNPFPNVSPKYIRAVQYVYHYTSYKSNSVNWWTRKKVEDYLPAVTKDHQMLNDFLKKHGLSSAPQKSVSPLNVSLLNLLTVARSWATTVSPPVFLRSVAIVIFLMRRVFGQFFRTKKHGSKR